MKSLNRAFTYKVVTFLLSMIVCWIVQGQEYVGLNSSNYAGISGVHINPSSIVDSRYKYDINLLSWEFYYANNYVGLYNGYFPFMGDNPDQGLWEGVTDNTKATLKRFPSENMKHLLWKLEFNLPSAMFTLHNRHAAGFSVNFRNYVNINKMDPKLARLIYEGFDYPPYWHTLYENDDVNIQSMSWMEYEFHYGTILADQGTHFFKGGGSMKYLQGINAMYFFAEDLNYSFLTEDSLHLERTRFSYGHSDNFVLDDQQQLRFKNTAQPSFGIDLGLTYEYRPNFEEYTYESESGPKFRHDKNKYKFKGVLSVTDIGAIRYQTGIYSKDFQVRDQDIDLEKVQDSVPTLNPDSILDHLFTFYEVPSQFSMSLPTSINFQADYKVWKDFYVNATGIIALPPFNKKGVRKFTKLTITPRWDAKWYGVFLPVTVNRLKQVKPGLVVRGGPITIGMNDLGFFMHDYLKGANFFMTTKVPIFRPGPAEEPPPTPPDEKEIIADVDEDGVPDTADKCPNTVGPATLFGCPDDDKDSVINKNDECPETPGVYELAGCPDRDGDGIIDNEDECPDSSGIAKFNGCPDLDGDGMIDFEDSCATQVGPASNKGCPLNDMDQDSVVDKEDDCPEAAGFVRFNGCPDSDNDGIIDEEDKCPDTAGTAKYNGCPDSDGDNIPDHKDQCPQAAGKIQYQGCPDSDGDGFIDKEDECPETPGSTKHKGCPDTDEDGVVDKEDKCPHKEGVPENNGCPQLAEEEMAIIDTAFATLKFETGKAKIKKTSYPGLKQLAQLLKERSYMKLTVAGHTDNQGPAEENMKLSKRRATAVKDFLVNQGIDPSRIKVEYYGETKPIAPNDTEEGRAKNRRVEFKLGY